MLAHVLAGAVLGIDAYLVTIEADVASGLPAFNVGLPQGAVKEGRERVVACMQNSGFYVPPKRITVNLAPVWGTNGEVAAARDVRAYLHDGRTAHGFARPGSEIRSLTMTSAGCSPCLGPGLLQHARKRMRFEACFFD